MRKFIAKISLNNRGMTLAEVIIALVIALIVGAAALQFYFLQTKTMVVQNKTTDMQASARASFRIMTEKMVQAGLDPTQINNTVYTFGFIPNLALYSGLGDIISATTVLWTEDVNGDGLVQLSEVKGFKYLNNRIFQLGLFGGAALQWNEFMGGIESITFTYYNQAGGVLAMPAAFTDVRRVRVRVVAFQNIRPDPSFPADTYRRTIEADVTPRNRSF